MKAIKDFKEGQLFLSVLVMFKHILTGVVIQQVGTEDDIRTHWDYLDITMKKAHYVHGSTKVLEFKDFINMVKREFYESIE